jgi:hypothetical protein
MVQFTHIAIAYFVMGATMWAGGAIAWSDAGLGSVIVSEPTADGVNQNTSEQLESAGGPIQNALSTVGGSALIAVYNLVVGLVSFMFWPITVMTSNGVPARLWVPLGGSVTMAFYGGFIRMIRSSG